MSLQAIIDNIPQTDDEVLLVEYLSQKSTIDQASKLPQNELLLLKAKLKQAGYKVTVINDWLRQVKEGKRKKKQNNQQSIPSHIDIADMYIQKMGDETMYARSDWHRYEKGLWTVLPEIFFEKEVSSLLASLEKKYQCKFTRFDLRSVCSFISHRLAVRDELLDADDGRVNMKNGVFDVQQGLLLPHDPTYYHTTQLPFEYDETAGYPQWKRYLETTLVKQNETTKKWETDQELIDFLQEATGYSLTSSVIYQVMFWCIGKGANGKGVLFYILEKLAGNAAIPLDIGGIRQNNTYQLAMLAGKKIAYSTEAERNADMVSDGIIKSLVAGDPVMVRQIREKPFELRSVAKLWWSMNKLPKVSDTSHGFWRRVQVIPFNRIFENGDIDPNLKTNLEKELPGIFNWAIQGLRRVRKNKGFTEPKQVSDLTSKYRKESNPVEMFVEEEAIEIKKGDDTCYTLVSSLYFSYKNWCSEGNYRPLSRKNFKNELEDLGFFEKKIKPGIAIIGLKVP